MKPSQFFICILLVSLSIVASHNSYAQLFLPGGVSTGINNNAPTPFMEYRANGIWQGTIRANGDGYTSFGLWQSNTMRWAMYNHSGIGNTLLFANAASQDKLALTQAGHLGIDNITPEVRIDIGNAQGNGLQFRHNYNRIRLTPHWNSTTDARLDFGVEHVANGGLSTIMSVGYAGNVGVGTTAPAFKLDVAGAGARVRNPETTGGSYTSFRVQGPDYTHGIEIDFFGNNNITNDLNWSYGGGPGSAAIVNVNNKPLTFGTSNLGRMLIDANGNVGIGTFNPDQKLTVKGIIHAEEVRVDMSVPGPDYVFEEDYDLLSLDELKRYIAIHKHLPEVPSARQMSDEGLNLKEMNIILLKKVEELTLHLIAQQEHLKKQSERIDNLERKN